MTRAIGCFALRFPRQLVHITYESIDSTIQWSFVERGFRQALLRISSIDAAVTTDGRLGQALLQKSNLSYLTKAADLLEMTCERTGADFLGVRRHACLVHPRGKLLLERGQRGHQGFWSILHESRAKLVILR